MTKEFEIAITISSSIIVGIVCFAIGVHSMLVSKTIEDPTLRDLIANHGIILSGLGFLVLIVGLILAVVISSKKKKEE